MEISPNMPLPVKFDDFPVEKQTPSYLHKVYWWAYEHPLAVKFWDHGILIDLILLGNYSRLVKAVVEEFSEGISGNMLQMSCAYGKLTPTLQSHLNADGRLDVIDVLDVQLENVRPKLVHPDDRVRLIRNDATQLGCADASYDHVLMFFLPHELPEIEKRKAMSEAFRVVKPGGDITIVEFHRPALWHPLRIYQRLVFLLFEPFATDMWRYDLTYFFPKQAKYSVKQHKTYFGDLYQKFVVTKQE